MYDDVVTGEFLAIYNYVVTGEYSTVITQYFTFSTTLANCYFETFREKTGVLGNNMGKFYAISIFCNKEKVIFILIFMRNAGLDSNEKKWLIRSKTSVRDHYLWNPSYLHV